MDVLEAIEKRRSIRSYTERPVEKDVLEKLVTLAVKAPTGSGMEPWGFVVLQDKKEIDALSDRIKQKVLNNLTDYPHPGPVRILAQKREIPHLQSRGHGAHRLWRHLFALERVRLFPRGG